MTIFVKKIVMQAEIWKDVKDYEGFYQISNLGRLKSLSRIIKTGSGRKGKRLTVERIIKNKIDSKGYYHYELSKNGIKKDLRIHRLIAEAFIPKVEGKDYINHINGIKLDNSLQNLEWVTPSENIKSAYQLGLKTPMIGSGHVKSKIVYQYDLLGRFIAKFDGMREAGRLTGIESSSIGKCAQGLRKTAGGYLWKY